MLNNRHIRIHIYMCIPSQNDIVPWYEIPPPQTKSSITTSKDMLLSYFLHFIRIDMYIYLLPHYSIR